MPPRELTKRRSCSDSFGISARDSKYWLSVVSLDTVHHDPIVDTNCHRVAEPPTSPSPSPSKCKQLVARLASFPKFARSDSAQSADSVNTGPNSASEDCEPNCSCLQQQGHQHSQHALLASCSQRRNQWIKQHSRRRFIVQEQVYENQRYQLVLGWGSKGHLLPLDPRKYTYFRHRTSSSPGQHSSDTKGDWVNCAVFPDIGLPSTPSATISSTATSDSSGRWEWISPWFIEFPTALASTSVNASTQKTPTTFTTTTTRPASKSVSDLDETEYPFGTNRDHGGAADADTNMDLNGWQYAPSFHHFDDNNFTQLPFDRSKCHVRRRKWTRYRQFRTRKDDVLALLSAPACSRVSVPTPTPTMAPAPGSGPAAIPAPPKESAKKKPPPPAVVAASSSFDDAFLDSMEGWLNKLGHVRKNWKRRYFVLHKSILRYYADKHKSRLKGEVLLFHPATNVHYVDIHLSGKENTFAIEIADYTLLLQAELLCERENWMYCLEDALLCRDSFYQQALSTTSSSLIHDPRDLAGVVAGAAEAMGLQDVMDLHRRRESVALRRKMSHEAVVGGGLNPVNMFVFYAKTKAKKQQNMQLLICCERFLRSSRIKSAVSTFVARFTKKYGASSTTSSSGDASRTTMLSSSSSSSRTSSGRLSYSRHKEPPSMQATTDTRSSTSSTSSVASSTLSHDDGSGTGSDTAPIEPWSTSYQRASIGCTSKNTITGGGLNLQAGRISTNGSMKPGGGGASSVSDTNGKPLGSSGWEPRSSLALKAYRFFIERTLSEVMDHLSKLECFGGGGSITSRTASTAAMITSPRGASRPKPSTLKEAEREIEHKIAALTTASGSGQAADTDTTTCGTVETNVRSAFVSDHGLEQENDWEITKKAALYQIERATFIPLQELIYELIEKSLNPQQMATFAMNRQFLSRQKQPFFEIPSHHESPSEWRNAIEVLNSMDNYSLPSEKAWVVLQVAKSIYKTYHKEHVAVASTSSTDSNSTNSGSDGSDGANGNGTSVLTADDFLPILIFCICRCSLRHVIISKRLISETMISAVMIGETGYYTTMLEAAVEYIALFDHPELDTMRMHSSSNSLRTSTSKSMERHSIA